MGGKARTGGLGRAVLQRGQWPHPCPPVDPALVEENVEVHQNCNGQEEAFGYKKTSSC